MNQKIFRILALIFMIATSKICINAQFTDSVINRLAIFKDDFSKEPLGKFPANWISNRSGEVVSLKNLPSRWFKMHAEGTYLPQINQDLPQEFIIDFDFIHQAIGNGNNTTELTLFTKPKNTENDGLFPGSSGIKIVFETFIVSCLCYDNRNPKVKVSNENRAKLIQANNVAKISVQVDHQQLRVIVNGFECLNVPECKSNTEVFNTVRFNLWGSQAEPLIGNFKVETN